MKVYAHYKGKEKTGDGNSYRWRTLLQFGDSWECIGSVFMKNPGSAKPLYPTSPIQDEVLLKHLSKFSYNKECGWFHFSDDSTMRHIENLFRTYYKHKSGWDELNGVIQIFNLMNVMEPDLNEAKKKFEKANYKYAQTIEKDILQLVSPVYLGWSELGKDKMFREKAEEIFIKTRNDYNGNYLEQKFTDNSFYHPQYLMSYGKNRLRSVLLVNAFCQNTNNPKCTIAPFMKVTISKNEVYEKVLTRLKTDIFDENSLVEKQEPKLYRFKLNDDLLYSITIKGQGDGYIGIRHLIYKQKYSTFEYPYTDKYRQVLEKFGYDLTQDMWLGTKSFKKYGNDTKSIIQGILDEIGKLQKCFS
jgi:hypothetical protein